MGWDQPKTPIEMLRLPERYYNTLISNKIYTIEDLAGYSEDELLTMWMIGPQVVAAIKSALAKLDKSLPME